MISNENFYQKLYQIFSQNPELDAISLEEILDSIPTVDQIRDIPKGTIVLIRTDLDMPIKDCKVADLSRIKANSPTIKYCIEQSWKVVIFGHLGRDKNTSVKPVCEGYSEEIGQNIELISDWMDDTQTKLLDQFVSKVATAKPGAVFMLENTRKYDIEQAMWKADEKNFPEICKKMYSLSLDFRQRLTEMEINEAIAALNFDFSSSVLPLAMRKTALGFYISEELKRHIPGVRRANMVVFSGLKINKLDDLEAILERRTLKWVIAAGSLAMSIKKAQAQLAGNDFCIGRAETDKKEKFYISSDRIEQSKRIVQQCLKDGIELVLPIDFILDNGEIAEQIPQNRVQFDIGPKTRILISKKISEYIYKSKQTPEPFAMFYNGVFGRFEDPKYEAGTREFISHLRTMTQAGILTYVGGGEGRLALLKYGSVLDVTHAFTAGGTILKSLSNRHIPFLKAMYLQNKGY
ncbi:MAG: phosphoglycerate kinase [candidate division WOR-3 bacterium]|nr:phosphoglycerate kinase [candidate division WOR-3 bacterium]MDH5683580.1 phosphoglycerate kinase [candidate division WOR-3 bacterium]